MKQQARTQHTKSVAAGVLSRLFGDGSSYSVAPAQCYLSQGHAKNEWESAGYAAVSPLQPA